MYDDYDPSEDPSVIVPVDENGLRLAPNPVKKSDTNILPKAVQPFEFQPRLKPMSGPDGTSSGSTIDDFQPKKRDQSKRVRRTKRNRNIFSGVIMLFVTAAVAIPFVLGAFGVKLNNPIIYSYSQYNVIGALIDAIEATIHKTEDMKVVWFGMIPYLILLLGMVGLLANLIKSFMGIFGAVRPIRYVASAIFHLLTVVIVFIMALIGVDAIGVQRIDFMQEFIFKIQESEYFTLLALAVVNLLIAIILRIANPDKSGYLKRGV